MYSISRSSLIIVKLRRLPRDAELDSMNKSSLDFSPEHQDERSLQSKNKNDCAWVEPEMSVEFLQTPHDVDPERQIVQCYRFSSRVEQASPQMLLLSRDKWQLQHFRSWQNSSLETLLIFCMKSIKYSCYCGLEVLQLGS